MTRDHLHGKKAPSNRRQQRARLTPPLDRGASRPVAAIDVARVTRLLVEDGRRLLRQKRALIPFTGDATMDHLLNDIERMPHLFVLGCVVDRQVKSEQAWAIPFHLAKAAGSSSFGSIERLSKRKIHLLLHGPPALHRFPETMSNVIESAIKHIRSSYRGDASGIWSDRPSSAEVVCRFLEFEGVGPKIATMAANILARQFKIAFGDYYAIDVSADIHIRRVFERLGLIERGASVEQVVYRARAMHPAFPGLLDSPAFHVGRTYCRPRKPRCDECFLSPVCPTAAS